MSRRREVLRERIQRRIHPDTDGASMHFMASVSTVVAARARAVVVTGGTTSLPTMRVRAVTSAAVSVTVKNRVTFNLTLTPDEIFFETGPGAGPDSRATGEITVNLLNGTVMQAIRDSRSQTMRAVRDR